MIFMNIKKLCGVLFIIVMLLSVPCVYALDSDEVQNDVKTVSSGNEVGVGSNSVNYISTNDENTKEPNKFIKSVITLGCVVSTEYLVTEESKAKSALGISKLKYNAFMGEIDNLDSDAMVVNDGDWFIVELESIESFHAMLDERAKTIGDQLNMIKSENPVFYEKYNKRLESLKQRLYYVNKVNDYKWNVINKELHSISRDLEEIKQAIDTIRG